MDLTFLKKYFWETDADKIDIQKDAPYIIGRVLEYGDPDALRWIFRIFGRPRIKKIILTRRGFSPKTANFWRLFFNLNKNKVLCLRKSYQKTQKSHWPY